MKFALAAVLLGCGASRQVAPADSGPDGRDAGDSGTQCTPGPELVATVDTETGAHDVALSGGFAYVADWDGLRVVDVSDPFDPRQVGSVFVGGSNITSVAAEADVAIVSSVGTVNVIDVADPASPTQVAQVGVAGDLAIDLPWAFAAGNEIGLGVIDLSNPDAPNLVGSVGHDTVNAGIAVVGPWTICTGSVFDGVEWVPHVVTVDVSDPLVPVLSGFLPLRASVGMTASGDRAYFASGKAGIDVVDISDPAAPVLAGSVETFGTAYGLAASGDFLYVAGWDSGLEIVDVSDPTTPRSTGVLLDLPGRARAVAISGSFAFVAADSEGLHVVDLGCLAP